MYLSAIDLGEHMFWNIGELIPSVHGETILALWFAISLTVTTITVSSLELRSTRSGFCEFIFNSAASIAKSQLGEYEYRPWLAVASTTLCSIILANWAGGILPWRLIDLPAAEIRSLTTDPNTTLSLASLFSITYFYAGLKGKGGTYFVRYITPAPFFLPLNILEDFTKPLSLSFRLFGNLLADEIIVSVLLIIYPYLLPVPLMINGLLGATIQGIVFSTLTSAYITEALEVE
jgi:F-type H+-transporting ATPase subunit a